MTQPVTPSVQTVCRSAGELDAARRTLKAFVRAGYELFPLKTRAKTPRDPGWQSRQYELASDIASWVKRGGNVGVRLRDVDLVLDVDPRNFASGDDPVRRLIRDLGAQGLAAPTVITGRGDGGHHIYLTKPAGVRVTGKLAGYQGIDVRTKGAFVVAPGSVHPETGGIYEMDELSPPIGQVRLAPDTLLAMLERRDGPIGTRAEAGVMSDDQLAELLAALDPTKFGVGHHDEWFALMASCHDATGGSGLGVFLDWCARDENYASAEHQEMTARRWNSLKAGRPGGVTYRFLLRAVADAGRPDLVAAFDADGEGDFSIDITTEDLPHYDFGGVG